MERMYNERQRKAAGRYSAVEEFEEAVRSAGWEADYRQISKGGFSTELAGVNAAGITLSSVNFKDRLQFVSEAPQGCVGFFLLGLAAGEAKIRGTALNDGDLVCFPAGVEMDVVVSEQVLNETILVPEGEFRAIARALVPSATSSFPEATAIYGADLQRCASMRREISSILRTRCLDAETRSNLLAMLVHRITDASPRLGAEQLGIGRAAAIARRAQAYIEDQYRNEIGLKDLCGLTGVASRTLQRCFASYFQIGPIEYIKVRRLNETRRALFAADPFESSVTQLATLNGFSHLGRFSVEYRAHFGESPSETLAALKPSSGAGLAAARATGLDRAAGTPDPGRATGDHHAPPLQSFGTEVRRRRSAESSSV